jgi:arginase
VQPLIIEVPSPLGLRPSGLERAPDALREAGLHDRLGVRDAVRIAVLDLSEVRDVGTDRTVGTALAAVARPGLDGFWVHVDVDVLDDAVMPAVDYRHLGGLSWREAADILGGLLASGQARGLEITIFNPALAPDGSMAAKLADLVAGAVARRPR